MRYYQLDENVYIQGRWRLGSPVDPQGNRIIPWAFLCGEPARFAGQIRLPVAQPGIALDFSMADAKTVPVVHSKVASLLTQLAPSDVQIIPVEIESQQERYCIVNVLRVMKCIDDSACAEVHYWTPEDGGPNREGKYVGVHGLRIDPGQVGDARVFRTWGWEIALIVSEEIKDAVERIGMTGAEFEEVG